MSSVAVPNDRFSLETHGRRLDVVAAGPIDGVPLVFHTGTPGANLAYPPFVESAAQRGLRYVGYSRPGYARSARREGRSVADCAADVEAVLAHLEADRCYTVGWSGGGPHALATAALLGERVIAVATVASVAPYAADGLDWLAGMGKENREEFGAALDGPEELRRYLEREARVLAEATPEEVAEALGDLIPEVDRAALTGAFATFIVDSFREGLREGIWGWFDDDMAFVNSWGFELADISVPIAIWQGAHDRMVPFAHGEWLAAHIPGARARLQGEHGHLSLAVDSFGSILDELVAGAS